jgi:ligand-binding sensor domain-containing protein/signal transduction histidine kinase
MAFVIVLSGNAKPERLPIKTYTTADGLAHNVVNRIVRDSRGFLWFCTREGLSRFDGYGFTNYGLEHGLPSAIINDLLETREGVYWVATAGGLCRFNPLRRAQAENGPNDSNHARDLMFKVYFPGQDAGSNYVLSLLQDREGVIWCGTRNGLYRVEAAGEEVTLASVDLGIPAHFESRFIECLLEDRSGSLWIGTATGLYRRWADGRVEAYTQHDGLPDNIIQSLLEDREGRIWVGTRFGALFRLVSDTKSGRNVVARVYSDKDGLRARWINQLFQGSDGRLWAGSNMGLIQFIPTSDGRDFRFRVYSEVNGLDYREVGSLAEDRNGNLWLGTLIGGAAKIARNGFTTFGKADGFSSAASIFDTQAGGLFVFSWAGTEGFINQFDGEKFTPIRPRFSEQVKNQGYGWGWNQTVLEDHTGEWWIATRSGVCRFPKLSRPEQLEATPPKAVYTTGDGLASDVILRLFEDSRGDVWISSVGEGKGPSGLSRWERSTGTFYHYRERDSLPRLDTFYVSSFAEDRAGGVWIGFSGDGGIARYCDGSFTRFSAPEGVPAGPIRNLFIDSAGHLWIPTYRGGLCRIDNPAAKRPRLVTYTTADGLSSNEVTGACEDQWGRLYIGTGRGIDRFDLQAGHIKHYTTADGLPLGELLATLRDRSGALWFSFSTGLARMVPEPDPPPVQAPVLITGLRIAGTAQAISAFGETEVAPIELGADRNQLQIEFVGLGFSPGEGLRYQYKLEGANQDWSQPAVGRTINFSHLAPGRYRFLVRAINADGVLSERAASLSFTILPPVWQRWWFMAITAALLGLVAYALYRYRLTRLLELERVRTRIAADLHDDIGSNLSQIAIWGEVARRQPRRQGGTLSAGETNEDSPEPLERIAATARETAAAMSDIVWAINPRRDYLSDLISRMRRFAGEAFDSRDIIWQFQAPQMNLSLNADTRREIFLIFKEAVNNIVRHARCSQVDMRLSIEGHWLRLQVRDDGRGFDPAREAEGNGLESMRERARRLGGVVEIESLPGDGTLMALEIPLDKPRRGLRWWR